MENGCLRFRTKSCTLSSTHSPRLWSTTGPLMQLQDCADNRGAAGVTVGRVKIFCLPITIADCWRRSSMRHSLNTLRILCSDWWRTPERKSTPTSEMLSASSSRKKLWVVGSMAVTNKAVKHRQRQCCHSPAAKAKTQRNFVYACLLRKDLRTTRAITLNYCNYDIGLGIGEQWRSGVFSCLLVRDQQTGRSSVPTDRPSRPRYGAAAAGAAV